MIDLKLIVTVAAAVLAASTCSVAQSYTLSPNDTIVVHGVMEDLQTLNIDQNNISGNPLYMQWEKVSESVPAGWEASVCDNNICFTTLHNNGFMLAVPPGESGFLLLHITAYNSPGTAIVRYAVWDVNTPTVKDTLTYILNVSTAATVIAEQSAPKLWLTQNKVYLQNNNGNFEYLRLYNVTGQEVYSTGIYNKTEIELPSLPTSVYIVQLSGKEGSLQQKVYYRK